MPAIRGAFDVSGEEFFVNRSLVGSPRPSLDTALVVPITTPYIPTGRLNVAADGLITGRLAWVGYDYEEVFGVWTEDDKFCFSLVFAGISYYYAGYAAQADGTVRVFGAVHSTVHELAGSFLHTLTPVDVAAEPDHEGPPPDLPCGFSLSGVERSGVGASYEVLPSSAIVVERGGRVTGRVCYASGMVCAVDGEWDARSFRWQLSYQNAPMPMQGLLRGGRLTLRWAGGSSELDVAPIALELARERGNLEPRAADPVEAVAVEHAAPAGPMRFSVRGTDSLVDGGDFAVVDSELCVDEQGNLEGTLRYEGVEEASQARGRWDGQGFHFVLESNMFGSWSYNGRARPPGLDGWEEGLASGHFHLGDGAYDIMNAAGAGGVFEYRFARID